MSRRLVPTFALAACSLFACDKSTPPDPAPAVVEHTDAKPTAEEAAAAEGDANAKKQAEDDARWAKRLADAEAEAAEKKKRWTPELEAKVTALVDQKTRSSSKRLAAILAGEHRAPGHADRDRYRHPAETLAFFGIEPDMRVFEWGQGAGWYSEILAPYLGKSGALVLAGPHQSATDARGKYAIRATELFSESAGNVYAKVEWVEQSAERDAPVAFGPDASLDAVLIVRMFHNVERFEMWDRVMPGAFAALKPGGVLGVVQHRAAAGADPKVSADKGYVDEQWLIERIESFGFQLEGKSEINANAKDTRDHEDGVWTLPPVLTRGDEDKDKYLAIGESDRSTLRFVKPKD